MDQIIDGPFHRVPKYGKHFSKEFFYKNLYVKNLLPHKSRYSILCNNFNFTEKYFTSKTIFSWGKRCILKPNFK